jgi:uncharacterized protein (TIGR00661 family)
VRFLFSVLGEGRGHYTQALSLSAMLRKHGHEVVGAIVGTSDNRQVPAFFKDKFGAPIYEFSSPNFTTFYKQRRPSIFMSVLKNISRPFIFRKSLQTVKNLIKDIRPDVVVNFYEMITGMAYEIYKFDKKLGIPMICIAHQYILLNNNYKTTAEQDVKYYLLRMLSKITSNRASKILALSFRDIPRSGKVIAMPPLLRSEVFELQPQEGDYIHGYMVNSGYFEDVYHWHAKNPNIPLRFFWDKKDAEEITKIDDNFVLHTLNDEIFLKSMAGSRAYATTSGFESICEALYYRKPIMMIPVHLEQEFNAFDAAISGAGITDKKFNLTKLIEFMPEYKPDEGFHDWILKAEEMFIKELIYKPTESR